MKRTDLVLRRQRAALWILNAQKATKDGGVSAWYNLETGYCATSYPEVTGYIIPTMFDLYKLTGEEKYRDAAIEMADWITSVQLESGAVTSMDFKTPYVFDTGQDIAGWLQAYKETNSTRYKVAAERGGMWLTSMQREDGSFSVTPFSNATHTYHARVSWMLLQLYEATGNDIFKNVAIKNLNWVADSQQPNGWCAPTSSDTTHFIAYAGRGLLESSQILEDETYFMVAQKLADALLTLQLDDGSLYGSYDTSWRPVVSPSCLTGNLQTAIIWLRLHTITGDEKYRFAAEKMVAYVSSTQDITSSNSGINGGIAGSEPIDGSYAPNAYLSWAAKFYIDAINLLLES